MNIKLEQNNSQENDGLLSKEIFIEELNIGVFDSSMKLLDEIRIIARGSSAPISATIEAFAAQGELNELFDMALKSTKSKSSDVLSNPAFSELVQDMLDLFHPAICEGGAAQQLHTKLLAQVLRAASTLSSLIHLKRPSVVHPEPKNRFWPASLIT